jgi:hypothetical protein
VVLKEPFKTLILVFSRHPEIDDPRQVKIALVKVTFAHHDEAVVWGRTDRGAHRSDEATGQSS